MREKDIFSASETDFMRGFRSGASGIVAKTCANELASRKFLAGKSAIQLEYVKFNDNIQHALLPLKEAGARGCSWAGNCVRMSGSRIKCNGTLGSQGGFEAVGKNGRLVISDQNLDAQCGYPGPWPGCMKLR